MNVRLKLRNWLIRTVNWIQDLPAEVRIKIAELRYGKGSEEAKAAVLAEIRPDESFWRVCKVISALEEYAALFKMKLDEIQLYRALALWINARLDEPVWQDRVDNLIDCDDYGEQIYQALKVSNDITDHREEFFISTDELAEKLDQLRKLTYSGWKIKEEDTSDTDSNIEEINN